jgi:hypothetical protein
MQLYSSRSVPKLPFGGFPTSLAQLARVHAGHGRPPGSTDSIRGREGPQVHVRLWMDNHDLSKNGPSGVKRPCPRKQMQGTILRTHTHQPHGLVSPRPASNPVTIGGGGGLSTRSLAGPHWREGFATHPRPTMAWIYLSRMASSRPARTAIFRQAGAVGDRERAG